MEYERVATCVDGLDPLIVDGATLRKEFGKDAPKVWRDFPRRMLEGRRNVQNIELMVLDSLDALEILARFENPRADLFDLFEWLRSLGITSLVLTEAPPDSFLFPMESSQRLEAGYLADGVLHLRMHATSDVEVQRRIRVVKMRGTRHEMGYLALHVGRGKLEASRVLGG